MCVASLHPTNTTNGKLWWKSHSSESMLKLRKLSRQVAQSTMQEKKCASCLQSSRKDFSASYTTYGTLWQQTAPDSVGFCWTHAKDTGGNGCLTQTEMIGCIRKSSYGVCLLWSFWAAPSEYRACMHYSIKHIIAWQGCTGCINMDIKNSMTPLSITYVGIAIKTIDLAIVNISTILLWCSEK